MTSQMKESDMPIVNSINVENCIKKGDNLIGFVYDKINVNEEIQHSIKLTLFPISLSTLTIYKKQILLEIALFNSIAFAITISLR